MAEENKTVEETAEETKAKKKTCDKKASTDDKKLKGELEKAKKELEAKTHELEEQNERYVRMIAEYDNYRKRTAKEKEGIYTDAYFDALSQMLPIIDNIERASAFDDGEKVLEGLKLILKSINDMLERMSVTAYGATGEEFDPNIHDAMLHVEREDLGENVIADVFEKGYKKGDRVLRHAKVTVAN